MTDETQTPEPQQPAEGNTGTGQGFNFPPVTTSGTSETEQPAAEPAQGAQEPASRPEQAKDEETPAKDDEKVEDFASPLESERNLPVGQVVGGGGYAPAPADLSGPEVEQPGQGHDSLAYDKHGTEATTAGGEKVTVVVAHPVRVDGTNRRSDDDALEGHKVKIVEGDYKDRKGVFLSVERHDPSTGYPSQVIVRTSDDENQLLSVPYGSIRPDLSQR